MTDIEQFIMAMPKAELHLHLEVTLEPEMMLALAQKNGVTLSYDSIDEIRAAYKFSELQDFLNLYYDGMSVLQTEQDYFDLTWAYLQRVHGQNVTHVEVFFDPQRHTSRGIAFETVLDGIERALDEAREKLGMSSHLILCFLRDLSQESAFEALEQALPHKDRIFGVGLDSAERGNPPSKFAEVFARARAEGFAVVAHAGEEGPAEYVREALDILKVDRIDHGNRAMDDPALVERLAASGMALTVCPLSNLRLRVVKTMEQHPLARMLDSGLCATVNSDDPAYFGGYVNENYLAVQRALGLSLDQIKTLARNSFIGSFMTEAEKAQALAAFDRFAADFEQES